MVFSLLLRMNKKPFATTSGDKLGLPGQNSRGFPRNAETKADGSSTRAKSTGPPRRSLAQLYSLVLLAGLIMQALIIYGYMNGERQSQMTSPLLSTIREIRLEVAAVEHEISDFLWDRTDHHNPNPWLYLDQSFWYLKNLLDTRRVDPLDWTKAAKDRPQDMDENPIDRIEQRIAALKADFSRSTTAPTVQDVDDLAREFDRNFDHLNDDLDHMEAGILKMTARERVHYRFTFVGMIFFCAVMTFLAGVTVHRYETHRKRAEQKLEAANEFLLIANRHSQTTQLLDELKKIILSKTGCAFCTIFIFDSIREVGARTGSQTMSDACPVVGRGSETASNRSISCPILHMEVNDVSIPLTAYGSYCTTSYKGDESLQLSSACPDQQCRLKKFRSLGLIPIRSGTHKLGLIEIADPEPGRLTGEMVEIIETAAMHIGTAIQRLRAEEALKTAYNDLELRVGERTMDLSRINANLKVEIEERRLAEEKLRDSRNTMQMVIDGIKDALILVDKDLRIRMINRTALELMKVPEPHYAIGRFCHEVVCPNRIDACSGCKLPLAVTNEEVMTFERPYSGDTDKLEQISIYPVADTAVGGGGAIVRITDITERKRIERQLIQSEKMASLGILVSSIAHEINNPNNFITFNIPILREYIEELIRISDQYAQNDDDLEMFYMSYPEFRADVFKLMDNIEHGSNRITNFVSNLRDFSQNNSQPQKAWLDLSSIIEKVLSICRSQIKKSIRHFNVDVTDGLTPIYVDEYSLEQILLNLIVNAVQAADKIDSYVKLTAIRGQTWSEHTVIRVEDNGCGIAPDAISRIFDPFFTTKPPEKGTGLGLYVCHNLTQRLGGRIEVESRPGIGSTFTLVLPDKDRRKKSRDYSDA